METRARPLLLAFLSNLSSWRHWLLTAGQSTCISSTTVVVVVSHWITITYHNGGQASDRGLPTCTTFSHIPIPTPRIVTSFVDTLFTSPIHPASLIYHSVPGPRSISSRGSQGSHSFVNGVNGTLDAPKASTTTTLRKGRRQTGPRRPSHRCEHTSVHTNVHPHTHN